MASANSDPIEGELIPSDSAGNSHPDAGAVVQIHLNPPHSGQQMIFDAGYWHRFNAVRCGRRFGKTAMLVGLGVSYACARFRIPTNLTKLIAGRVGIFTPSYKQGMEIWDELTRILEPLIEWKNRSERRIFLKTGGRIDMWHVDNNPLAGRGRKYHLVLMDEAAFTRSPMMLEVVWPQAIRPTLIDYSGSAWVFSTPNGIDDKNFFYAICNEPKYGFKQHHAPTSANPHVPQAEIDEYQATQDPRNFQQEILAEFIDWSSAAFFNTAKLLHPTGELDGFGEEIRLPVAYPTSCDFVIVVADTGMKGGVAHDGHAFLFIAFKRGSKPGERGLMWILDWKISQIEAGFFEKYLPGIFDRALELTRMVNARRGFLGIFMEEKALGDLIVQKSRSGTLELPGHENAPYAKIIGIDSKLVAEGKDSRAVMVERYHNADNVRITKYAYDKTEEFKKHRANHFIRQLNSFFIGDPKAQTRADDLLDTYTYALSICFGNHKGI